MTGAGEESLERSRLGVESPAVCRHTGFQVLFRMTKTVRGDGPNSAIRIAFCRNRDSTCEVRKSQCSRWITLGGAPRESASPRKSQSAVTIVKPSAAAYSQIRSSAVERAMPVSKTRAEPGKSSWRRPASLGDRFASNRSFNEIGAPARPGKRTHRSRENQLFPGTGNR